MEGRLAGSEDPKWAEAEASAKEFGKDLDARNRHLRRETAERVQQELLAATRLTNQLLLHNVRFSTFVDQKRTDLR